MQERDEPELDPRAERTRRQVADLLGEADGAERAQAQADLAADPALAAERARLEATIGLVRETLAADARPETLSREAAARLREAAERGRPTLAGPGSVRRAWYATPVFRAAAGFALVLGAFALWQGSRDVRMPPAGHFTADAKRQAAEREAPFQYEIFGQSESAPAAAPARDERGKSLESDAAKLGFEASLDAPKDKDDDLLDALTALGYGAGGGSNAGAKPEQQLEKLRGDLAQADLSAAVAPIHAEAPPAELHAGEPAVLRLETGNTLVPTTNGSAGAGGEVESRFGGRFGARANSKIAEQAAAAQAAPPLAAKVAGADEFFLGAGERKNEPAPADGDNRATLERLRVLGYVDGGEKDKEDGTRAQSGLALRFSDDERMARQLGRQPPPSIDALLEACRRRPNEQPRDMFYRWWGDNPFEYARTDPLSTFAVDVDTASYALARRYLVDGHLPTKSQIRTEEFVNYFKGDVPAPTEDTFAVATELAPSPFDRAGNSWTLRVALRGREVSRAERQPLALTFVVDVSGSMKEQERLELVKHALRLLVGELDARDSIAIVAFNYEARLVLPRTSARQRGLIESAIHPLMPQGGTNVQAGLRMGYEAALSSLDAEAHDRVVLLSDGVGNIGETDAQAIVREVEGARSRGVWLNTVGVGMNNHNDAFLEQLADKGDGVCNYVDDAREARRALVENFTGAFEPIARDVKIQVAFDPAQVERYRLLGYENRAVADADFRNDAVDAGEVGAGHQVVALYEVVRSGDGDGPLATVRVRWAPAGTALAFNQMTALPVREAAWTVDGARAAGSFAAASAGFRRSVLVGQLAEVLRRSIHARDDSLETLLAEARKLAPELADPDFDEFVQMIERTIELSARDWDRYDELARRLDQLRMQNYLKAKLEDVARELDRARIDELDGQIRDLEAEIRRELEQQSGPVRSLGYSDGVGDTDDR